MFRAGVLGVAERCVRVFEFVGRTLLCCLMLRVSEGTGIPKGARDGRAGVLGSNASSHQGVQHLPCPVVGCVLQQVSKMMPCRSLPRGNVHADGCVPLSLAGDMR